MTASLDERVAEALARVRADIADLSGGRRVSVIAVTKGFGSAEVLAAVRAGADGCGENYAQEMLAKVGQLSEAGAGVQPPWHFVGRLQRNKVRQLAAHVAVWQSVDRVELGGEIARRAPGARVLVQCNISGESNKGGCAPEAVPGLVADLQAQGLDVAGVMGVAAAGDRSRIRREFEQLVAMADDLGLPERSIGMSGDYRDAVESGATMVRLGTVLFGSRA